MGETRPALEYLVACSDMSLESFQISRMNEAANLRRQIRALVDRWIEIEVDAGLAGSMLECRRIGTTPPKLRLISVARSKSFEKAAISSRRMRFAAPAMAVRQQRLITCYADDSCGRVLALSGDETEMLDEYRNTPQHRVPKVIKPNAMSLGWACPRGSAEEAGAVVMSVGRGLRVQRELQFDFEGPVASDLEGAKQIETIVPYALLETWSAPSDGPLLHNASHCFAEAGMG